VGADKLGEVEADTEVEAVAKAAKEFRTVESKLMAVRQQTAISVCHLGRALRLPVAAPRLADSEKSPGVPR
jgi:hypothetical protein